MSLSAAFDQPAYLDWPLSEHLHALLTGTIPSELSVEADFAPVAREPYRWQPYAFAAGAVAALLIYWAGRAGAR